MREVIVTGKTVEEAVDAASRELGMERGSFSYEVLEMPRRRLFSSVPAKIRAYVDEDEYFSVKELLGLEEKPARNSEQPVREEKPAKKPEPPVREEKPAKKPEPPVREEQTSRTEEAKPEESFEEVALQDMPQGAKAALEYLQTIAKGLGAERLEYKAAKIENGIRFIIDGEDAAILIGRRGETMDALQYLCLLVSNRASKDYCKITIDVAAYRKKREKTLEELAKRIAAKVKKNRRSQTLEPMNPYERRIVHSTIQAIDGVKSESIGEDPNRRVVISLAGAHDDRRQGNGSGYSRQRRDGGARRPRPQGNRPSGDRPQSVRPEPAEQTAQPEITVFTENIPEISTKPQTAVEKPQVVNENPLPAAPKQTAAPEKLYERVMPSENPIKPAAPKPPKPAKPAPKNDADDLLYKKIEL